MVFEKTLEADEKVIAADEIVLVRGRVDHKEPARLRDRPEAEPFDPSEPRSRGRRQVAADRGPRGADGAPRVDAARLPAPVVDDLQRRSSAIPGRYRVRPRGRPPAAGLRCLRFGDGFKVKGATRASSAELDAPARPAGAGAGRALPPPDAARDARAMPRPSRAQPCSQEVAAMSSGSTALPLGRRGPRTRTGGPRSAARTGTRRSPSAPISPSPRFAWRSRLEPSGVCRVVDVQRAEPVEPDDAVELVEHRGERLRASGCRSRDASRWQESRHTPRRSSPPAARSAPRAPRRSGRACRRRRRCSRGAAGSPRTRRAPRGSARRRARSPRRRRPS